MKSLEELRAEIDGIDDEMRRLFIKRMETVRQIHAYKKSAGAEVYDPARERQMLEKNEALVEDEELRPYYACFLMNNTALSRQYQRQLSTGVAEEVASPAVFVPEEITAGAEETGNLILIGMPGSGKSTIGRLLAEKLGMRFADVDVEIIRMIKMPIADYLAEYGEESFRKLEKEIIEKLASLTNTVIATGGGSVLKKENMAILRKSGRIYFIDRPMDFLSASHRRPLSEGGDRLKDRLKERYRMYSEECDFRIEAVPDMEENIDVIVRDFLKKDRP